MKTLPKCGIDVHVYLANEKLERQKEAEQERVKKSKFLEDLLKDVADVFDVNIDLIKTGDSHGLTVMVRKIFYYIAKTKGGYGYMSMAKVAGRIDHTSCIYHIRKVEAYLKVKDPDFLTLWNYYLENSNLYTKNDFR